jgi:plasmid stability protein
MEKTTLYLPDALRRSLRAAAKRTGRHQADLIREALDRYLREEPRPLPRSVGAGEDREVTARDSERWLKERWSQR